MKHKRPEIICVAHENQQLQIQPLEIVFSFVSLSDFLKELHSLWYSFAFHWTEEQPEHQLNSPLNNNNELPSKPEEIFHQRKKWNCKKNIYIMLAWLHSDFSSDRKCVCFSQESRLYPVQLKIYWRISPLRRRNCRKTLWINSPVSDSSIQSLAGHRSTSMIID